METSSDKNDALTRSQWAWRRVTLAVIVAVGFIGVFGVDNLSAHGSRDEAYDRGRSLSFSSSSQPTLRVVISREELKSLPKVHVRCTGAVADVLVAVGQAANIQVVVFGLDGSQPRVSVVVEGSPGSLFEILEKEHLCVIAIENGRVVARPVAAMNPPAGEQPQVKGRESQEFNAPVEGKWLMTTDEANRSARARFGDLTYERPSGIACPKCGAELVDDLTVQLDSNPPQTPTVCKLCGYRGSHY